MSNDVFPARNLSPEAEPWGRTIEERIVEIEGGLTRLGGTAHGTNRNIASSTETLAEQIQELERLYKAIPKPAAASVVRSGFALSPGWTTVASVTIPNPGATQAEITAVASGQFNTTTAGLVQIQGRLLYNDVASPPLEGYWMNNSGTWVNVASPSFSWVDGTPGESLTIHFQVNPAANIWPAGTGSVATLAASAMFTG